ncbi:MAG: thiamine-phosphate kinase [Halioglobus sp.]
MAADEFSLIYRYFSSLGRGDSVELGVGDDCAILKLDAGERLATSVDTMVESVHFPADAFPEDIGFRVVAAAASDLAAMGARPIGMTVALTLPEPDEFWLHAFSEGVAAAVKAFNLPLVGGDTTRGPLTISVQVLGALPHDGCLLRSGAKPGDKLYVSGTLGDAAAALAFLDGDWQPEAEAGEYLLNRFYRPDSRLELGRSLLHTATSAIDISDGLLADATHVAQSSGCRLKIRSGLLPLSRALQSHPDSDQTLTWALTGGDDYELLVTLPADFNAPASLTCIGEVIAGEGVECDFEVAQSAGYRHFQ